jgi:hypothetical protein
MNELKPCPFCGKPAYKTKAPDLAKFTACSNRRCFLYNSDWISKSVWKSRPIEDALRAENERLRGALQSLFDRCMLADEQGELSELISGDLLDNVGALLGYTPENAVKADKELETAILKALNEVTK